MVVILICALLFLCCETSESSARHSDEEYLVNQETKPIVLRTVTCSDEFDRTLRIYGNCGEINTPTPSFDITGDEYCIFDRNDGVGRCTANAPPSSMSHYSPQTIEEPPPPYMASTMMIPDSSPLLRGNLITSSTTTQRYGDTHPETTIQRPPPFAPWNTKHSLSIRKLN